MKRFINERDDLVGQSIDGLLMSSSGGHLCRLDDPDIRVVLRADWDRERVALISGGGSGHEPAHAGFVGEGMLTAAVCGEVFASPSVQAVLSAIVAVTGASGCLLIVKNYTGDRLNFGLAAERARALGLMVEMVVVGDDVALPEAVQARGIAGTLFVHKLAGAAAAAGLALEEVTAAARDAAAHVRSIGVSLSSCNGYGAEPTERLGDREAALGLGIHGEPGAAIVPMGPAGALVGLAVERLLARGHRAGARYAVLVNNLGAVPPLEMAILVQALAHTPVASQIALIVGPAPFMTSLDMNGFSLSLLELDAGRETALQAMVTPLAWQPARAFGLPALVPAPGIEAPGARASSSGLATDARVRALIEAGAGLFGIIEAEINALDAEVGDGDTGSTFAQAAAGILRQLDDLPTGQGDLLLGAIGELLLRRTGGSSGVLLATLFTAAGTAYAKGVGWVDSFVAGLDRMMAYGGAGPGDRTLIDALEPALAALSAGGTLAAAARAARGGADATRSMDVARAGRSAYVPRANLLGVTDPGAEAVARLFERLASVR